MKPDDREPSGEEGKSSKTEPIKTGLKTRLIRACGVAAARGMAHSSQRPLGANVFRRLGLLMRIQIGMICAGVCLGLSGCDQPPPAPPPPPENPYSRLDLKLAEIEAAVETGVTVERLSELVSSAKAEAKLSPIMQYQSGERSFDIMDDCLSVLRDPGMRYYYAKRGLARDARDAGGYSGADPKVLKGWREIVERHDRALRDMLEAPKLLRKYTASLYSEMVASTTNRNVR